MKIVIDARIMYTSTGRYVERLLHYLQEIDHTNQYVILLAAKDFPSWQPTNANFSKEVADYPIYSRKAQFALAKQLNKLNADLVHFPFQVVPVLYRKPYVVTVHDLTQLRFQNRGRTRTSLGYRLKQKQLALNFKIGARYAKMVITDTEYVKRDLLNFMPNLDAKKVRAIHCGADTSLGTGKATDSQIVAELKDHQFILYVGTAQAHKNLDRLVDSFALVRSGHPPLHLALAGKHDDIYRAFIKRTKAKQIPNIHFLGFVSDAKLTWLYRHAMAYVFPSLSEGFGLPGLEAMQFGTPVISSNATCLPEVYGQAAQYFDASSTPAMASTIDKVLADQALLQRLAEKGLVQVKKYSWRRMATQILAVYEQSADIK